MIRLLGKSLPASHTRKLKSYQRYVDRGTDFAERVRRAKVEFAKRNRKSNETFQAVKGYLDKMCSGARRCCYCEDSAADEVEHIRPKNLYPGKAFAWANYLYACGPCNSPKNDNWAVLDRSGNVHVISRTRGRTPVAPIHGKAVFINPRREHGLDFMELDLLGTYLFVPTAAPGTVEHARAEYTIRVLHLNDRDYLPRARRAAYRDFLSHLRAYVGEKAAGGSVATPLSRYAQHIGTRQHPSVWAEMKRQHARIPELAGLFAQAPEALGW